MQRSDCSMPDQARLLSLRSFRHGAGASNSPKVPGYPFRACRVLGSREGRCAEARALRMAHRCSLRQSQMPRPLRLRISGLTARPIRSLSTLRDHGHPWTTTQDSLPVWRPPPFTVGTFTRGLRFKVSGATSFLFDQAFLARCDLRASAGAATWSRSSQPWASSPRSLGEDLMISSGVRIERRACSTGRHASRLHGAHGRRRTRVCRRRTRVCRRTAVVAARRPGSRDEPTSDRRRAGARPVGPRPLGKVSPTPSSRTE